MATISWREIICSGANNDPEVPVTMPASAAAATLSAYHLPAATSLKRLVPLDFRFSFRAINEANSARVTF
ncbi:hypothetical protein D3C73_1457760 [compost metagenome]